jgi:hypothetical protein
MRADKKEMNIRKVVTFMANLSLTLFLLAIGIVAIFHAIVDRDMVMFVGATLTTLAGTCNGYYFVYNQGVKAQSNGQKLEEDK